MKVKDALKLLESAPMSPIKKSALNKSLSQKHAVDTIRKGLLSHDLNSEIGPIYLKRVWQVVKNQKRPRYDKN